MCARACACGSRYLLFPTARDVRAPCSEPELLGYAPLIAAVESQRADLRRLLAEARPKLRDPAVERRLEVVSPKRTYGACGVAAAAQAVGGCADRWRLCCAVGHSDRAQPRRHESNARFDRTAPLAGRTQMEGKYQRRICCGQPLAHGCASTCLAPQVHTHTQTHTHTHTNTHTHTTARRLESKALAPLFDLINHADDGPEYAYDPIKDRFSLVARRSYAAGEQVFWCVMRTHLRPVRLRFDFLIFQARVCVCNCVSSGETSIHTAER